MDGIDTSLPALLRPGLDDSVLRQAFQSIQENLTKTLDQTENAVDPMARALASIQHFDTDKGQLHFAASQLPAETKSTVFRRLETKEKQLSNAVNISTGTTMQARAQTSRENPIVIPG